MISASKEFKEKLKKGANVVDYADFTLSDGTVLHLEPKDFMIGGCQIEDKTTDGKFGVGFCIGKTLTLKIANHDERFSRYDFYQSIINLYVAMQLDDGTIEKIRKGVFYTVVPETPGDIIEISAVDGMYQLDKDYSTSTTAYPATLQSIISDACLDCGIPIGFAQFDNMNFTVQEKPEKATYRQIVSYACQIAGYNAHIDNNGYMQLIWYNSTLLEQYNYVGGNFKTYPHDTVISGGNFTDYNTNTVISGGNFTDMPEHIYIIKSLNVSTDGVQITGVRVVGEEDNVALFGEKGYLIEVSGNPFVNGREQEVANYLGNRIVGIMFRPFTAQVLNNPLYEPFEIVRISDRKGNVYVSVINSISYKIGGYTQISCEAENPARNGSVYASPSAQAVVEARKNVEKHLENYDKAIQNMTQIAGNALGYHTTVEKQSDGSVITYLHDKPTLEESKIIYKQSIDGFFISQDGGKSYTAGFDKNGNAVVNILYAIGIVADWIKGGTLTLGGFDNIDGSAVILDANGKEIGRLDKTGITTSAANITGGTIQIVSSNSEENIITISNNDKSATIRPGYFMVRKGGATSKDYAIFDYNGILAGDCYYTKGYLSVGNALKANSDFNYFNVGKEVNVSGELRLYQKSTDSSIYMINEMRIAENLMILKEDLNNKKSETKIFSGSITITDSLKSTSSILGGSIGTGSIYTNSIIVKELLAVNGVKSRITKTQSYSDRLLYSYETPKPYFGDIGEATLDENGICYIFIDDIFLETINTDCQYQVFLQKYGQGDAWVEKRTSSYFIVKGTSGLKFGWEIKARQIGFEMERMEKFTQSEPEETIDYEAEAQKYIDNYYMEVLDYEKSN